MVVTVSYSSQLVRLIREVYLISIVVWFVV